MNKHNEELPVPNSNVPLLFLAGILLMVPVVALLWVGSYAREEPTFLGFPFFIWYQFLWVLLCPLCTGGAYVLVRRARQPQRKEEN
jgi:Protein of unknown function (DUF3311).